MTNYIDSEDFSGIDFTKKTLQKGEYDNCSFSNCDFEKQDISNINFIECNFNDCNLSNCRVKNVMFQETTFQNCKMIGVNFSECNPFLISFTFNNCILNYASFYQFKLKNTNFTNCKLQEVDFVEADLTNSKFKNCNLEKTIMENTVLEKVDFSTAYNFAINPEINNLKNAQFSKNNLEGLLTKYQIKIK